MNKCGLVALAVVMLTVQIGVLSYPTDLPRLCASSPKNTYQMCTTRTRTPRKCGAAVAEPTSLCPRKKKYFMHANVPNGRWSMSEIELNT